MPGRGWLFPADRGGKVGSWAKAGYRNKASAKQHDQESQERLDQGGLRSQAHTPEPFLADQVKRVRGAGRSARDCGSWPDSEGWRPPGLDSFLAWIAMLIVPQIGSTMMPGQVFSRE
jgi:hypothetical protein